MRVRVQFRVNTETGQVEEFLVEDISTEDEPEHDAVHDRIALEVGRIVERRPAPHQVTGQPAGGAAQLTCQPSDELPATDREETTE